MSAEASTTTGFSEGAPRRILWLTIAIGLIFTCVAAWRYGMAPATSFVVGTVASYFNFQLLHAAVGRLGAAPRPGSRRIVTLFIFRYFALGLLGYATVKVFGVSAVSFCAGLLVTTAALLVESLRELIYARA
ncbi:MAG: ATP synthase subunit I [Bryobacterales bacterium]|nr:ATP synthase subunit I [Bryobacterales bacterium]